MNIPHAAVVFPGWQTFKLSQQPVHAPMRQAEVEASTPASSVVDVVACPPSSLVAPPPAHARSTTPRRRPLLPPRLHRRVFRPLRATEGGDCEREGRGNPGEVLHARESSAGIAGGPLCGTHQPAGWSRYVRAEL